MSESSSDNTSERQEHTATPWAAKPLGNGNHMIISGPGDIKRRSYNFANDLVVGATYERNDILRLPAEANARRIVAAVNACDGIPTEALEAGVVADLLVACEVAFRNLMRTPAWGDDYPPSHWVISHNDRQEALADLSKAIKQAKGEVQP